MLLRILRQKINFKLRVDVMNYKIYIQISIKYSGIEINKRIPLFNNIQFN